MITVIIPCYNGEKYLAEALESVVKQTRPADEILVVDDCSTDSTRDIAEQYPVELLSTERNSGHATARNIGIKAAKSDLIAWLDADDYFEPNHLEVVGGLLDDNPEASVAYSGVRKVGSWTGTWANGLCDHGPCNAFDECFKRTIVPAMSAITRTDPIRSIGGFDESIRIAPDFDLWLRFSIEHQFISTSQITSNYRGHGNQISSNEIKQWESVYAARWKLFCNLKESDDARWKDLEKLLLYTWDNELSENYYARQMEKVRALLSFSKFTPSETETSRKLKFRSRIPSFVFGFWDFLKGSSKAASW